MNEKLLAAGAYIKSLDLAEARLAQFTEIIRQERDACELFAHGGGWGALACELLMDSGGWGALIGATAVTMDLAAKNLGEAIAMLGESPVELAGEG